MSTTRIIIGLLRWSARLVGMAFLAFVVAHIVSEGLPKVKITNLVESLLWGSFALVTIGLMVLWRWELPGGIVALLGITMFYIANYWDSGQFPGGWVFPVLFLPGCFSVIGWLLEHSKRAHF